MKRSIALTLFALMLGWVQTGYSSNPSNFRIAGIPVFYFNPTEFPDHYAADDPRVTVLPEAERTEARLKIFEDEFKIALNEWSSVSGSTFVAIYGGQRTDVDCYDNYDGIFVLCPLNDLEWFSRSGREVSALAGTGLVTISLPFDLARDGFVHYNAEYSYEQTRTSTIFLHEVGHVLGLGHEFGVPSIMGYLPLSTLHQNLYPDDIAGLRYLYPFTEACAPVFDMEGGQLGFWAEIYLPGVLHRVRLNYREPGYLEVVAAPLLDISSQERSCALKLDGNELFIPYIELEGQTYWLKLELNPVLPGEAITLDLVDYQPVPD